MKEIKIEIIDRDRPARMMTWNKAEKTLETLVNAGWYITSIASYCESSAIVILQREKQ
jgi:hypothetical protein